MSKKELNASELIRRAKWDDLTPDEIDSIAQIIQEGKYEYEEDLPSLIGTLGSKGGAQYREVVEKFLYYRACEIVCFSALYALCNKWHLTADYLKELKMFIKGVEWDPADDLRKLSISIAGDFLAEAYDRELLYLLLEVFENLGQSTVVHEKRDGVRLCLQCAAYQAIATAMGKKWDEIPSSAFIEIAFLTEQLHLIDFTVIQQAHQMLEEKN